MSSPAPVVSHGAGGMDFPSWRAVCFVTSDTTLPQTLLVKTSDGFSFVTEFKVV